MKLYNVANGDNYKRNNIMEQSTISFFFNNIMNASVGTLGATITGTHGATITGNI